MPFGTTKLTIRSPEKLELKGCDCAEHMNMVLGDLARAIKIIRDSFGRPNKSKTAEARIFA
jgi:hypothetical protein